MARTEGMRGMMKGNWTNCVRIIPNSAMKFFTYEQLSRCGGNELVCTACSHTLLPALGASTSLSVCCSDGLGRALPPTACCCLCLCSHTMHCNQNQTGRLIADHQREKTGSGQLTPVLRLLAGAGAGIVAMSATYPLDMVRGRLTVQEGRNVQYTGIMHAARTIMREVRCCAAPCALVMRMVGASGQQPLLMMIRQAGTRHT